MSFPMHVHVRGQYEAEVDLEAYDGTDDPIRMAAIDESNGMEIIYACPIPAVDVFPGGHPVVDSAAELDDLISEARWRSLREDVVIDDVLAALAVGKLALARVLAPPEDPDA